jgi:putative membrane protein
VAAAPTASAAAFVPTVVAANLFEVETSRLALDRTISKSIKDFANRMVADHTLAAAKLKQAVAGARLPMPAEKLDARRQAIFDKLNAAHGEAFEKGYIAAQYDAHVEAVGLFKTYAKEGDTPQLKAFAADLVPMLEGHLSHVSKLR